MVDYPNQRVITLAEWDAVKEGMVEKEKEEYVEYPEEEEEEEITVEHDEGEMLVLRRTLNSSRRRRKRRFCMMVILIHIRLPRMAKRAPS